MTELQKKNSRSWC